MIGNRDYRQFSSIVAFAVAFFGLVWLLRSLSTSELFANTIQPNSLSLAAVGRVAAFLILIASLQSSYLVDGKNWLFDILRDRRWKTRAILGFGIGAIMTTSVVVMFVRSKQAEWTLNSMSFDMAGVMALRTGVSFVGVIFEEMLFRGYILGVSERIMPFAFAATFSSSIFGLAHLGNPNESLSGAIYAGLFGLLLCASARIAGSIWLPIGVHAGWNWSESFIWGSANSGNDSSESIFTMHLSGNETFLNGGFVGLEGSAFVLVGMLVLLIFLVTQSKPNR